MAPSAKFIFLFTITLLFSMQIHARESQFFSKVTNVNNNDKETTTTTLPNKEEMLTKREQQPVFIPQTENGYGLYGHESGQLPPTTTTPTTSLTNVNGGTPYTTTPTNAPYKTVFDDEESLNKYLDSNNHNNNNYNPNTNTNYNPNTNTNYYYNKNNYQANPNGVRDTRLTQRGGYTTLANHNNNNNYYNNNNGANMYNAGKQGMSDTRFLENGKYYYDLNTEVNYNPNRYGNSKAVDSRNWNNNNNRGYYGNNNENTFEYKNSMEGYQNEEEFQESQDEFDP